MVKSEFAFSASRDACARGNGTQRRAAAAAAATTAATAAALMI